MRCSLGPRDLDHHVALLAATFDVPVCLAELLETIRPVDDWPQCANLNKLDQEPEVCGTLPRS
jgi:hypothetical protein